MDNNQEQLHNNPNNQDNTFPEEFEMKWGTDDLPKGMKRRGSQHHNSHSESHHSTHSHHKSSSHHRKTNRRMDEGEKRSFQDLIYREQARKKETTSSQSVHEEPGVSEKTGSGKPNAVMNVVREEKPVLEMKVSDTVDSPASNDGHTRIEEEKINETIVQTDSSEPGENTAGINDSEEQELNTVTEAEPVSESEDDPESEESGIASTVRPSEEPEKTFDPDPSQVSESTQQADNSSEKQKRPNKTSGIRKKNPGAGKTRERKKWSGKKKAGIAVLCVLLALIVGGLGFINGMLGKIGRERSDILPKADPDKRYEDIDKTDKYGVGDISLKPIKQDKVKNILLIGQDRRKGDGARMRSDSMIVATIDLTTNEIKLTSLMRDMYIPVPGYGYGMINATYLNGGMALLNETIEQNFGITIDGNVEVDFDRFIKLMDLVGPIEIDLNKEEVDYLNNGNKWDLKVGTNTMTSEQVLAYARTRYVGRSDWERTDRQRSVVTKIFNKLRTSDLPTLYNFANAAFPLFKTDLSNTEILRYVYTVITNRMTITQSKRIPVDGTYTQEIKEETLNVLVPKLEPNAQALQKFVYGYSNVEVEENDKREEAKKNAKKKKSSSLVIDE